ncbi:hypothetical protein [Streptomyces sp. AC495_CC817]|uniref:hypothetical protein n=1 Tax=Streptomyces sp. AC495_CC817 TaxID=2823900 RepID=UPI001C270378|nr:hypothetical protein [Streptomyces sp. AC495_CC817]
MLHADDTAELRALQARAYGRDGGLTDAEARRLRELEDARTEGVGVTQAAPDRVEESAKPLADAEAEAEARSAPPTQAAPGAHPPGGPAPQPADAAEPAPLTEARVPSLRDVVRARWRLVAAASALLVAIGVGAGWALFAPRSHEIPLTEAEVERRAELYETGKYDDGSLRIVARDDDAVVWFATRSGEPDLQCVVLDVGDLSNGNCVDLDAATQMGLNASVSRPVEDDGEGRVTGGESVSAYGMLSLSGEPMIAIQRWNYEDTLLGQFEEDDRPRAQELIDDGYSPNLSIIGSYHEKPVWLAERLDDSGTVMRCLVVDDGGATACGPDAEVVESGLTLAIVDDDGIPTTLEARFTGQWRTPYLTITGATEASRYVIGPDGTIEFGVENGDPIIVEAPVDDPDG